MTKLQSLALSALLAIAAMGCEAQCGSTHPVSQALPSGRSINVVSNWGAGVSNTAETTTIDVGGHTIVIEPTRILLDNKQATQLSPKAKDIQIACRGGKVEVVADGKTVYPIKR